MLLDLSTLNMNVLIHIHCIWNDLQLTRPLGVVYKLPGSCTEDWSISFNKPLEWFFTPILSSFHSLVLGNSLFSLLIRLGYALHFDNKCTLWSSWQIALELCSNHTVVCDFWILQLFIHLTDRFTIRLNVCHSKIRFQNFSWWHSHSFLLVASRSPSCLIYRYMLFAWDMLVEGHSILRHLWFFSERNRQ